MKPQERADRLRNFSRELEALEREHVLQLTPEQRARLNAYVERTLRELAAQYDVDTTESQRQVSLGMRITSALGGLALCAAVVLFLARYMGDWPTWVQVSVLATGPMALTLGAEYAAHRERTLYYTALVGLVAFAAFIANLTLLGSIFNLAPTPNALAAWGLFGLALAYHFGTRRLSFLKSRKLLTVVEGLGEHPSGRHACLAAGVTDAELPSYERALATLADSGMITARAQP